MARKKSQQLEDMTDIVLSIIKDCIKIGAKNIAKDGTGTITFMNDKGETFKVKASKINGPRSKTKSLEDSLT